MAGAVGHLCAWTWVTFSLSSITNGLWRGSGSQREAVDKQPSRCQ